MIQQTTFAALVRALVTMRTCNHATNEHRKAAQRVKANQQKLRDLCGGMGPDCLRLWDAASVAADMEIDMANTERAEVGV